MKFAEIFDRPPEASAGAPGRVNLLGEHTDYNDGFVLPTAIPQRTTVQLGTSGDGRSRFYSEDLDESVDLLDSQHSPSGFASYLFGCIDLLRKEGNTIPPLNLHVHSTVPMGAGLSSSAALEVACLRALRQYLQLEIDDVEIALLARQAEIQYAGVHCGIMDQMASSFADPEHILFLDTRTLEHRLLPFPDGTEIVVLDSGVPRRLASSGYNQRRAECEEAALLLGVPALRDITALDRIEALPEPYRRRARHVVTENHRVLEVVEGVSAERFGELMNASHASLRDDYEVSIEPLDRLVEILQGTPGVFGARLTGAGFGGACVALVAIREAENIAREAIDRYHSEGHEGKILVPSIDNQNTSREN